MHDAAAVVAELFVGQCAFGEPVREVVFGGNFYHLDEFVFNPLFHFKKFDLYMSSVTHFETVFDDANGTLVVAEKRSGFWHRDVHRFEDLVNVSYFLA